MKELNRFQLWLHGTPGGASVRAIGVIVGIAAVAIFCYLVLALLFEPVGNKSQAAPSDWLAYENTTLNFREKYEHDVEQADLQFTDFQEFVNWLEEHSCTSVNFNDIAWRDLGWTVYQSLPPLHLASVRGDLCLVYRADGETKVIATNKPFLLIQADGSVLMATWLPLEPDKITVVDHRGLDDALVARLVDFQQEEIDAYISSFHGGYHLNPLDPYQAD